MSRPAGKRGGGGPLVRRVRFASGPDNGCGPTNIRARRDGLVGGGVLAAHARRCRGRARRDGVRGMDRGVLTRY